MRVLLVAVATAMLASEPLAQVVTAPPAAPGEQAAAPAQPVETAPPEKKSVARDPNEVICETVESTGYRLARRRICLTRAERERIAAEAQRVAKGTQLIAPKNCQQRC